jgi:hypothetical protein
MCRFCEWDELFPRGEPEDPEAAAALAAERQRASQESWARLMDEITRADTVAAKGGKD